jgi:hypothetical protein
VAFGYSAVRFLLWRRAHVAGAAANIFLKIPTWRIFKYAFARYICEANSRGTPVVEGLSQKLTIFATDSTRIRGTKVMPIEFLTDEQRLSWRKTSYIF